LKAIPIVFLLFIVFEGFSQPENPSANVIDARHWKINEEAFAISGPCQYFDQQLLSPSECKGASGSVSEFPSLFKSNNQPEEGIGYATYLLTVLVPTGQRDFALSIPQIYSSYKLWVNGSVVAENGAVGKTAQECKPQWKPQTVEFQTKSDTLLMVLQIANFDHAKGGIKEQIYLGKPAMMKFKRSVSEISKLTESAVLFCIGFFFLMHFVFQQRNKATLYFSLLTLTWSVRSLFSNLYLFISFYPDFNWASMIRIEYITLYLAMIWAILFLTGLFHNEANVILKYALVFCNVLFTAFSLSSTPRLFTQGLNVYLIVSGILLLYGAYIIIRAWGNERAGSGLLTLSIILGLNIFGYDIFVYEGFSSYDPVIFSAGYISIFLMMGFALAFHVGLIKAKQNSASKLTYEDLYKNL
jgi:hypothetical protein